jgi:ATP-binding cassette, subfamily B, bacterial
MESSDLMPSRAEAFWPTEGQETLLRAALFRGERALDAWETWKSRHDLVRAHLDPGSFRLLPLVYKNLAAHGVDDRLMARLKGIYRFSWCANQRLFHEAAQLLQGLHEAGIRTMVLKGLALSMLYYRDRGARPMSDVDVLVGVDQVDSALDCLGRMGWRVSSRTLAQDLRFRHAAHLLNDSGQEFDLHWHVFYECLQPDADEGFWRRAVPTEILHARTCSLDPTDALLHTVVHGIRWDEGSTLRWIPDAIAILHVDRPHVDWDRLLEVAQARQLLLRLAKGLRYLHDRFQAPVPAAVLERSSAHRPSYMERTEYHYLGFGEEERKRVVLGYYPFILVEYLRFATGRSLFRKAMELPEYLRYRLSVQSHAQLLQLILSHAVRKTRKTLIPGPPTTEPMRSGGRDQIGPSGAVPIEGAAEREPRKKLLDPDAWRSFGSCYRGKLGVLLFYAAVATAQSLLVLPVLLLIRRAFDEVIPQRRVSQLVLIGAGILAIRLANSGVSLWLRAGHIKVIKDAVQRLREDLLTRLYVFSRAWHTRLDWKTTHAQIVQDTERLDNMSNQVVAILLPAVFTTLALLVLLAFLNWALLLVILSLAPLLLLAARVTGVVVKRRVFAFQRAFERFSKGTFFVLQQMDLTRAQSFQAEELERRKAELHHLKDTGQRMAFVYAVHGQLQSTVVTLCGVVVLVVGGTAVARGAMTIGEFLSFWVAASLVNGYVTTITQAVTEIISGNESMVTLYRLAQSGEAQPYHGGRRIGFTGRIDLEGVDFAYDGAAPVLKGVTLHIRPGSDLAIIGPNGAGKSTILYLILGFYQPAGGRVLADGIPYDELDLVELRRAMGVVMQHPTLFSGTILENIAYGCPDATLDDIRRAARIALADEFVENLPDGYDTQVGEEGTLLSGGEAQRIALARAFVRRPRLLLLDEPTNNLEGPLVDRLMNNLRALDEQPAIVTISHDREALRSAQEVYRLENGLIRRLDAPPAGSPGGGEPSRS